MLFVDHLSVLKRNMIMRRLAKEQRQKERSAGDTAPMRLAFMGSPDFAVPALRALHAAGHDDRRRILPAARPAGRGQAVRPCPVHAAADALGLPVRTPARLRTRRSRRRPPSPRSTWMPPWSPPTG